MDGDRIEEALSSRSRCHACGVAIDKGELRFGAAIIPNSSVFHWHHLACAQAALPERFAAVADTMAICSLPARPDDKLAPLLTIERSPSNRAKCQQCGVAIATGALRIEVRLPSEVVEAVGFEFKRSGYIHFACAPAYTKHAAGLDAYLAKRAIKKDASAVVGFAKARQLVPPALMATREASVVGDWLAQYHGIVLPEPDLLQLVGALAPVAKKKKRLS